LQFQKISPSKTFLLAFELPAPSPPCIFNCFKS
jgi:hypothetical protein